MKEPKGQTGAALPSRGQEDNCTLPQFNELFINKLSALNIHTYIAVNVNVTKTMFAIVLSSVEFPKKDPSTKQGHLYLQMAQGNINHRVMYY